MKKLMLTAVALCAAIASQAATANWKATGSNVYVGNTTDKYSGSAYVFDAGVVSQSALFDIIASGTSIGSSTDGYAAGLTIANGVVQTASSASTFAYGEQSASASDSKNYSFYFVILDDSKVYFSTEKAVVANATTTPALVGFGSQLAGSQVAPTATGYAGAGKWSSVPEPTSGLLMLLGFAGLALRRKQK